MASLKTYALPGMLGLLQAYGLMLALVADAPWEWFAWPLVAAPALVFVGLLAQGLRKGLNAA